MVTFQIHTELGQNIVNGVRRQLNRGGLGLIYKFVSVKRVPVAHFTEFIDFFPLLELPFNLLPDLEEIPSSGLPLPGVLQETFILPIEGGEVDEFTEYIPYGRIMGIKDFHALIYWKAGLMQYEFVLVTYTLEGSPISHAIIGGMRTEDSGILHSVAVVHPDLTITIAEGVALQNETTGLDETNTYQMSIQPSGQINYGINEESSEIDQ